MRYEWTPGTRMAGDPNEIGAHIDAIRHKSGGTFTTKDIVADARQPSSPLHGYFDWDLETAAERWWLVQAGHLVRSIVVQIDNDGGAPIRAFSITITNDDKAYGNTVLLLSDEGTRAELLARALAELESWQRRYEHLTEAADAIALVVTARHKLQKQAEKKRPAKRKSVRRELAGAR